MPLQVNKLRVQIKIGFYNYMEVKYLIKNIRFEIIIINYIIFFTRLAQEGLGSLFPFIGDERKFTLLKEDLVALLQCDDPTRPPEIESLSEHIQNQVKDLSKLISTFNYRFHIVPKINECIILNNCL